MSKMDNQTHEQTIEINEDSIVLRQFVINDYGLVAAAVLAFLIKISKELKVNKSEWFSVTTEDITSSLNISRVVLRNAIKTLKAASFIQTKTTWFPTKQWYQIHF